MYYGVAKKFMVNIFTPSKLYDGLEKGREGTQFFRSTNHHIHLQEFEEDPDDEE